MEVIPRMTRRILLLTFPQNPFNPFRAYPQARTRSFQPETQPLSSLIIKRHQRSSARVRAGWLSGLVQTKPDLPDITKAGDPVLHEPAQEVRPEDILSERIQKIVDDMIKVMRKAPGVGLAAPQIGVPLRVNGLDRDGKPVEVDASGWQARILQHECDHLDGTLYVDKMVQRSFRTVENLDLPLPNGFPKLGVRNASKS
ncbi:hypothetical protein Leryth_011725 [Lithospermum erythrorhizon]|nr:hypothetical protein Leryth_011725 [Lithospermum erythrorhizon]